MTTTRTIAAVSTVMLVTLFARGTLAAQGTASALAQ